MKRKVKIDFCDIGWNHAKVNHFLYRVLSERFDLELCDQSDFLIHDLFGQVHRLYSGVRIMFTGEGDKPDYRIDDYSLNPYASDDPRHLHLPAYVFHGPPDHIIKRNDNHEQILTKKTKFCSFVVSNYNPGRNQNRIDFFKLLSRYKQVDSAGKICNNIGGRLPHGFKAKAEFLNQYKFNICFENSSKPGYTTEKIYDAMVSRCLPIYWGDPMINQQFNPRSFLNRADFPSDEALVEKIIELDKDDAKYLEFMRQPYLPNDEPTIYFSKQRILDFFERIFTTPIKPAAQKYRSWFSFGRWKMVKRHHWHPFPNPSTKRFKGYDCTDSLWEGHIQ